MASHLTTGRINLGILRDAARRELLDCLNRCSGTKAVVWDEHLIGPFGLISEYALLKDHEVIKMFPLKPGPLPPQTSVQSVVFLSRPKLHLVEIIADNVRRAEADTRGPRKEFHIFFVPRKSLLCEKRLKELGVFGTFTIVDECCIELFPFDNDLISMEMGTAFRECHLDNDMTSMFHVAKALVMIQSLYGIIPSVYGKGQCAKQVYDLMLRMRREMSGSEAQLTPQIDTLFLIDRSVDLLSPLVTQLTYEGLIDEIYGISNTNVKLPPEKFNQQNEGGGGAQELASEPKNFILNSSDSLFAEIRDKHFNAVGPILSKKAKQVSAQYEERHSAKTVVEMRQFVNKLPQLQQLRQSISTHTTIGQLIKDVVSTDSFLESHTVEQEFLNYIDTDKVNAYIEDCIGRKEPLKKILRLVCIQSLCNSGLKQKVFDHYRREILQTYGFQHLLTLENLEKVGVLRLSGSRTYPTVRKTLRLTVEEYNEQNPRDVAYVHSGYAPLSVRLAQHLARPGWRSIGDILGLLPGVTLEETQQMPLGLRKRRSSVSSIQSSTEEQKVTLVFFLGGCTYAEASALRFLSLMEEAPTEYVVATTQLINGTSFISSLMEPPEQSSR